jgi:hypothetical protein
MIFHKFLGQVYGIAKFKYKIFFQQYFHFDFLVTKSVFFNTEMIFLRVWLMMFGTEKFKNKVNFSRFFFNFLIFVIYTNSII